MSDAPNVRYVSVDLTTEKLGTIGNAVLQAMNTLQAGGHSAEEVLAGALYAVGSALAQRGVVLQLDTPLRDMLQPFVYGYVASQQERAARGRPQ